MGTADALDLNYLWSSLIRKFRRIKMPDAHLMHAGGLYAMISL